MPELPEVETIRRGLQKAIVGRSIAGVEVRVPKLFHGEKNSIIGKKVLNVDRRAKQIIVNLEGPDDLLVHLKMTGQLIYRELRIKNCELRIGKQTAGGHPSKDWFDELPNATTHIIFDFSDGSKLFFNDLRKFGWIKIVNSEELKVNSDLGPEPFSEEFTAKKLAEIIASKPKWNIKKILTDQSLISGIGNIYADESLFYAKILPTRVGSMIKYDEVLRLHTSIIKALNIGLKYGGSSENTYVQIDGSRGKAQEHFQVYSREGQKCFGCDNIVKKIRLNGRGTHFCEGCQK
ncbi:MAG: bifunctional DNA-formamidopyrimidine glycosylase/DNA-(apurinic or apyrimidinic site) lyase [Candidatus Berkelbacteria bacterium]|nr:bifunctional DNA-formamidopyrimidine glycosylase/DNA-(apurinic or apyrimidinic site) lyase [Candidatus Berkelbacteria bacterium]